MKFGVALFALTAFLASILLFTAEPMIGKMVLPSAGGTPAVWNTCLVYFQFILLMGYALSGPGMAVGRGGRPRFFSTWYLSGMAVLLVLACASPPLSPGAIARGPGRDPVFSLLWSLIGSATIPLLVVAATAPLVQNWFAMSRHPRARDPYFLYAASNGGSLLALLSYPLAIEPNLSLASQSRLWKMGLLALAALLMGCVFWARGMSRLARNPDGEMENRPDLAAPRPAIGTVLSWLALVFIPSSWLMGLTTYLTTDLAPIPLLWVIPLALYLLSFMVAFAGPESRAVRLSRAALPFCIMPLVLVLGAGFVHAAWIPLHLATFFVGAVACHGSLARLRPPARYLSGFYITIAAGGLLGGIFNAIVAPMVFNRLIEYPLAIVSSVLFAGRPEGLARPSSRRGWLLLPLVPGTVFVVTALLATSRVDLTGSLPGVLGVQLASGLGFYAMVTARRRPVRFALTAGAVLAASGLSPGKGGRPLLIERDFFGMIRVTEDAGGTVHRLFHGSTLHGREDFGPNAAAEPSTYFTRSGPIGQLFASLRPRLESPGSRVAVVGLGAGTLAAYAQPGQEWTFYEIDPAIERIARDPRYFTYLRDCRADSWDVVLGDARLRLAEAPEHAYRLIVLDAFSSDSLPVHLVTREAIRLYRSRLAEGGVLAFNISNRYLDLDPLMGRQAEGAGLVCRIAYDVAVAPEERAAGREPSIWAVMAVDERDLGELRADPHWRRPRTDPTSREWTDDYSDLIRYFRWTPARLDRAGPSTPRPQ